MEGGTRVVSVSSRREQRNGRTESAQRDTDASQVSEKHKSLSMISRQGPICGEVGFPAA